MANEVDIQKYTSDELDANKLRNLIYLKKSFQVVAVKDISFLFRRQ
jgi:hypothetical protein